MKNLIFLSLLFSTQLFGSLNFEQIYPQAVQTISHSEIFSGDRHGDFEGDFLVILSDQSKWKIHPEDRETYANWEPSERVHVKLRKSFYWFNREHKFFLYNIDRDESVRAMIIDHKKEPAPIRVTASEIFYKKKWVLQPSIGTLGIHANFVRKIVPSRKILQLSDGSRWEVRDKFNLFQFGDQVFIGVQGQPDKTNDFILIIGTEREAEHTWAQPVQ